MKSKGLTDLDKLTIWIENNNNARLKYVEPRSLAKEMDVTEERADELLSSLVDKGQAIRYFIFECPGEFCQEEILVESDDINKKTDCDLCNSVFIPFEERENLKYIAYEIYKKNNNFQMKEVDYKSKYLGVNKSSKSSEYEIKNIKSAEVIPFKKENENKESNDYKIFISHNEKDSNLANIIIDLLEDLGVDSDGNEGKIFCSSALGRGCSIGDDIFEVIKDKFDENIIVLFLFTPNFYKSPACMCEMGATWVKVKEFVPLIIEPMEFPYIKGIINTNIKGFDLSNYNKFSELTDYFIKKFELEEPRNKKYEKIKEKYMKAIELYKDSKIFEGI